ncbi:MAG: YdeI/OmpD-associated family protein [Bacteroidetes bacterium]|nr:YdeI/OmpD-associated family protein [Bacteroidota bacterium]
MGKTDIRIDAYIEKAETFARPILTHLRALVHEANPDVVETIKWGFASFDYKGTYCSMASFKQHVVFGFWKSDLIKDTKGYLVKRSYQGGEAMGNLGRITKLEDLPPDEILMDFILQAKKLNDDGIKIAARPKAEKTELIIPDYFTAALQSNKKAMEVFEKFSYSAKKEYVVWITEAKTEKTRLERLNTAVEWISEGKIRNWKYIKC